MKDTWQARLYACRMTRPTTLLLLILLASMWSPAHAGAQSDDLRFRADTVDKTQNPCTDFYQYACSTWTKTHPIPPDRSAWDPYYELQQKNVEILRGILEGREAGSSGDYRKVTDYYASCMDEMAIEKNGLAPLRAELLRVDAIRTPTDSVAALAALHTLGSNALFSFYPDQDLKNAEQVIATIDIGTLGMTDRDYYVKDDAETRKLREEYRAHVARMLEYSGLSPAAAQSGADAVLRLETEMAKASPTREQRRDPSGQYHKLTRAQLNELVPSWPWREYFGATGAPSVGEVNVTVPEYLRGVGRFWLGLPVAEQEAYLRWQLVHALAVALPAQFAAESFHYYGTVLHGTKEMQPRWKPRTPDQCASRRGGRQGFRRRVFFACGQAARDRDDPRRASGAARRHLNTAMDDRRDTPGSTAQARSLSHQGRPSGPLAGLQSAGYPAR